MSGLAVSGVADSGVVDGVDTVLEGRRPDVSFEPNRAGCSGSIDEDRTLLRCGEVGMQQWSARTRHCPSAQGRRRITELVHIFHGAGTAWWDIKKEQCFPPNV